MITGKFYKHQRCKDVIFKPNTITENTEQLLVQGRWFNIAYTKIIVLDNDTITIKREDIPDWIEYEVK